jgi:hypothetical protein
VRIGVGGGGAAAGAGCGAGVAAGAAVAAFGIASNIFFAATIAITFGKSTANKAPANSISTPKLSIDGAYFSRKAPPGFSIVRRSLSENFQISIALITSIFVAIAVANPAIGVIACNNPRIASGADIGPGSGYAVTAGVAAGALVLAPWPLGTVRPVSIREPVACFGGRPGPRLGGGGGAALARSNFFGDGGRDAAGGVSFGVVAEFVVSINF